MTAGLGGLGRRQLIARIAAAAGAALAPAMARAGALDPATTAAGPKGSRDPADPDLLNPQLLWAKILSPGERETAAALCDVILPGDEHGPPPSRLDVHDFIDEWVSAPYPRQQRDRGIIRGGLAWINTEATARFGQRFAALAAAQMTQICDEIAVPPAPEDDDDDDGEAASGAGPLPAGRPEVWAEVRAGARFFDRMRHLTMLGYYTTPEGMKDLGYVGNVPQGTWSGPPEAVLQRLGLLRR